MRRVVCIESSDEGQGGPHVYKGRVYTVLAESIWFVPKDTYYKILEMDPPWRYKAELFIDLIEDQKDEREFVRGYNKETA